MNAEAAAQQERLDPPYRPGFADWLLRSGRLNSRFGWTIYTAAAVTVTLTYWSSAWAEGTLPARAGVIHLVLPLFAFVGLPALMWFNVLGQRALSAARPLLKLDDAGYQRLTYRLTTMPAPLALVAAGVGLLSMTLLTIFRPPEAFGTLGIFVTPMATLIETLLQLLLWAGVGVVGVEIARKLIVIDDIYRNQIQINVLRPGALSAFSRFSAAMVIFTLSAVALGTLGLAPFATSVVWLFGAGVPTLLSAFAFVAPLYGAHRLMALEKARNLDWLGDRIATTIAGLRDVVDTGRLSEVAPLKEALEGLIVARDEFRAVSTWPWQRSTLTGVITALVVPMAVWLLTRTLESVV